MEFTPSQIARLVLGYLKSEKCQIAFDAFFNTSSHFAYSNNKIRSKYIVTRIQGYSLRDFLNQYAQIYNLIQERLEPTDYFEEYSSKNIVDQIIYLLDKCHTRQSTPQRSRSSTPIKETNKNKCLFQHSLSIIQENNTSELNTTPLEALPGNSNEFFVGTLKRKSGIRTNKNTVVEESDSGDSLNNCSEEVEDVEVLKQTFLEHPELHEKIAENINLVIKTAEVTNLAEEKISDELDTAIKAIVERTEADPIFEKLIDDLIGPSNENDDTNKKIPAQKEFETEKSECSFTSPPKTSVKQLENSNEVIKERLNSTLKQVCDKVVESNIHTETKMSQTEEVQSEHNPVQKVKTLKQLGTANVDLPQNLTVNTNSGDVILYDGTLDNYMKNSTPPVINQTNPLLLNNNLLMIQPGLFQQAAVTTPIVNSNQIDKPYYVLNSTQLINVSVPQYKVNNVTEQDILNMPTVIVCDDDNQQAVTTRPSKPTYSKQPLKILPKETPETNIRDYLTLYKCTEENQSAAVKPNLKPKSKSKKKTATQTIHIEILKPQEELIEKSAEKEGEKEEIKAVPNERTVSPRPVTPELNKQNGRKTTPKSGSHVRALDFNFSTPGHLPAKKVSTSPKSPKKKTPIKTSSTKISKSLFGTPSKNTKPEITEDKSETKNQDKTCVTKNNSKKQKKLTSWDADLRALMGPVKERSPPKKKKKDSNKRCAKKVKSKLNNTEIDAEAIERNLQEMFTDVKVNETEIKIADDNSEMLKVKEDNVKKQESNEETLQETLSKVENEDDQATEFTVTLINCNTKSKFRKKCNIDNNISKAVKITKVKEIKSLELVPDSNNKLILSPSKLNANKRTLVENIDKEINLVVAESTDTIPALTSETSEIKAKIKESVLVKEESVKQDEVDCKTKSTEVEIRSVEEHVLEKSNDNDKEDSVKGEETIEKSCSKFVTPEMPKIPNVFPITANRNLTPVLETPIKSLETPIKSKTLPKTPGAYTPDIFNDTPMTKMLNEQLQGVDILSIQTPKFPLTPSLPFTPYNTKSPYPHRSTDYSTTSSYYQPSDSEQNKSLEVLLEECKRLENQKLTKEEKQEPKVAIQSSISEKICSFNQSVIAKKNLNLVKEDLENSSSCENTSSDGKSSSSSDDDTDSSDSLWKISPSETVVSRKGDTPYMLRSRKKEDKNNASIEKIKTIQDIVTQTEIKPELEQYSSANVKEVILKEIEEKRQRTIAKFKEVEKSSTKRKRQSTETSDSAVKKPLPLRDSHGKFLPKRKTKSKRVRSNNTVAKRTPVVNKRKSRAPMKLSQLPVDIAYNDNIRDITLHISSDDDIQPYDVVETELLESSSSSISDPLNTFKKALNTFKTNLKAKESNDNVSDQEAAILVQGLKERGIYLVPNKTPNKQSISTKNDEFLNLNCEKHKEEMIENENAINESIKTCKEKETHDSVYTKSESSEGNKSGNIEESKSENIKKLILLPSNNINLAKNINKDESLSVSIDKIKDNKDDIDDKKIDDTLIVKNIKHNVSESNSKSVEETRKLEVLKSNDALNISLEDGEILSDDESEKVDVKTNLKNNKKSKKTPSKPNNSRSNKNVSKHSSLKSSRKERVNKNRSRKPSRHDDKKRSEKTSKHSSQRKFDKLDDSKSNRDTYLKMQKQDSHVLNSNQNPSCNIEQDLNLTDSAAEETFDDKVFVEETVKLVYDHRKTSGKTLNDYDLPISNKCFVVEVYGEEKEMSVTSFKMILDVPEKKSGEKVTILQNALLTTGKNSSRLHNVETNSPLENLYSESNTVQYQSNKVQRLKLNERRRNSADQKSEFQAKNERNTRSKSVDYYSLHESVKKDDTKYAINISNKLEDNLENTDVKGNEIVELTGNSSKIRDVDGLSPCVKPSPKDIDDELMNYAICGSERVEDDGEKSRPTKRKAKEDVDDNQLKKIKCQELLKNINVDMFLTQLHGDN